MKNNTPAILLVDDIQENLILLQHIIQPLDIEVISASSGNEALRKVENTELFLALVDVKMPGMDGIELASHLQKNRTALPIIFITAYAERETLERCYDVGAVDFISKPFQHHILLSKVKVFLELYNQKDQLRIKKLELEESSSELDRINKSLKKYQKNLSELTAHLEEVRESERKRIALDLHDDLGQRLTAMLMDMSWCRNNLESDHDKLTEKINSISNLLKDTIQTVRKISMGLWPSSIEDLGLSEALKWHINDYGNNTGIKCVYNIPETIELDPKLSILLFRVVQEALTNIARHAKANNIDIILKKSGGHIHLEIHDDGIGITQDKIDKPKSFGLLGMKERVGAWGGNLKIIGQPCSGTRLIIDLPVKNDKK